MKSDMLSKNISVVAPTLLLAGRNGKLICLILSLILFSVLLIQPKTGSSVRLLVTDIVSPVLSAISSPFQNLAATITSVSGVAELKAENAKLSAENARLKEWYQSALMLQAENQSLHKLLNFKIDREHKFVTARVISDAGNAFVKTLLVAAGQNEGVQKNQAVLAGEGMAGRIIEAGRNSSRILLLTDINSRVPILIEGTSQKAILVGNNTDLLELKHIPNDAGITEGMRVVTSGHGGVFLPGLPIGRIIKSDNQQLAVRPYTNMNQVTYVRVLDSKTDTNYIPAQQRNIAE